MACDINDTAESKLIFSPQLANFLLKKGYQIIKLKPKRNCPNESVFVFEIDEYFPYAIDEWKDASKEEE